MEPNPKYAKLASEATLHKVADALRKNGIEAVVVKNSDAAKKHVLMTIPKKAQVMTMTSITAEALGLPDTLNGNEYESVRGLFKAIGEREKRQLGAAPDWTIGSCHAITEDGHILIASNTGSQLPAFAYGAAHAVLLVGAQKIVKNLDEGMKRIYEYSFPLEDLRAQKAYGVHSAVNKILIINKEVQSNRLHVVLIEERLGY